MGPRLRESRGGEGGPALFALRSPAPSGGFSLTELLITVIIVGILAAVALPNFGKAVEKAKVKGAQSTLAAIAAAERVYRLDQGTYGTLANLTANRYASDPDAGNSNVDWDFTVGDNLSSVVFQATATRTGGGYDGKTIQVDQNYTGGKTYDDQCRTGYTRRIYCGSHILRD